MKTVRISDVTNRALAAASVYEFRQTGEHLADGTWLIEVEDDTYENLQMLRLPGETDDDAIQRMLHTQAGRPNN